MDIELFYYAAVAFIWTFAAGFVSVVWSITSENQNDD